MRKIAIANRKGGVGKTTSAVHIAAALALGEHKVLLIDTDTQAQCGRMLGVQPPHGLVELLDGEVDPAEAVYEARPGLWLLAGSSRLSGVTRDIARRDYRSEAVLTEALAPYEGRFDFVLLDGAPGYNPLSINMLFYAREILAPVSTEAMAVEGLAAFVLEVERLREHSGSDIRYVVPTFLDGRVKKSAEILEQLQAHFADKVLGAVHYSSRLSEAAGWGRLIYEYAQKDRTALEYAKIAGRIARDG